MAINDDDTSKVEIIVWRTYRICLIKINATFWLYNQHTRPYDADLAFIKSGHPVYDAIHIWHKLHLDMVLVEYLDITFPETI